MGLTPHTGTGTGTRTGTDKDTCRQRYEEVEGTSTFVDTMSQDKCCHRCEYRYDTGQSDERFSSISK